MSLPSRESNVETRRLKNIIATCEQALDDMAEEFAVFYSFDIKSLYAHAMVLKVSKL